MLHARMLYDTDRIVARALVRAASRLPQDPFRTSRRPFPRSHDISTDSQAHQHVIPIPRRGRGICFSAGQTSGILMDTQLIFEVRDADEGGYCARALGHAIFTQAEDVENWGLASRLLRPFRTLT